MAAITGGKTFGVANKIKLVAVKVLAANGRGKGSEVIAGLSFVLSNHKNNPKKKSVVKYVIIHHFDAYFFLYCTVQLIE